MSAVAAFVGSTLAIVGFGGVFALLVALLTKRFLSPAGSAVVSVAISFGTIGYLLNDAQTGARGTYWGPTLAGACFVLVIWLWRVSRNKAARTNALGKVFH